MCFGTRRYVTTNNNTIIDYSNARATLQSLHMYRAKSNSYSSYPDVEKKLYILHGKTYEYNAFYQKNGDVSDQFKKISYSPGLADCMLLCFSVTTPKNLDIIKELLAEVRKYGPQLPVVLVGMETEQRDSAVALKKFAILHA